MSNNYNTDIEDDGWGRSEPIPDEDCNDFNGDKNMCKSQDKCEYNESNSKCSKKKSVSFRIGGKKLKKNTRRRTLSKRMSKKKKTKRTNKRMRKSRKRGGTRKDTVTSVKEKTSLKKDEDAMRPPEGTHPDMDLFKGYRLEKRPIWPTAFGTEMARKQGYRIQDEEDL